MLRFKVGYLCWGSVTLCQFNHLNVFLGAASGPTLHTDK